MRKKCLMAAASLAVVCFASAWFAPASAETINIFKVAVTYYDFHNDGSTPDFGTPGTGLWTSWMPVATMFGKIIKTDLDTINRVPQKGDSADTYGVYFPLRWFRPWSATESITYPAITKLTSVPDSSLPVPEMSDTGEYMTYPTNKLMMMTSPSHTSTGDTAYKNVQVLDSLTFAAYPDTIGGTSTAIYPNTWRTGSTMIFNPLAARGFSASNDPSINFFFTMELHNQVTYKGGEILDYATDDDGAVFINNKLVIDNMGLHGTYRRRVKMDSVASLIGLTINHNYPIDLFYAERGGGQNSMQIVTDLEFVNKRSGTTGVKNPLQMRSEAANSGIVLLILPGKSLWLPEKTSRVSLRCYSAAGQLLLKQDLQAVNAAGKSLAGSLRTSGFILIQADCFDANNRMFKTVCKSFATAR
jgi:fibro-slime domain-containing protein